MLATLLALRQIATVAAALCLATAAPVDAQDFETVGGRARGMAGAFVAVADDATAAWWNPAGLATMPVADVTLFWSTDELFARPDEPIGEASGGWRLRGPGFAFGTPVLGLLYLSTSRTEVFGVATAGTPPDRQDSRTAVFARCFRAQHLGVSLTQSLGDRIVIGATVRAVRGELTVAPVGAATVEGALDIAAALEAGSARWAADADLGVMAVAGRLRVGLTARNLSEPVFEGSATRFRLDRQVRVGAAFGPAPGWGRRDWTVALDADVTTSAWADGERRGVAVGAERWWRGGRLAARGGIRAQTVGRTRAVAAAGGSLAVRSGVLLEGEVVGGGDAAERGWGLAIRVTY